MSEQVTETATVSSSGSVIPGVHPSGSIQSAIERLGMYRTGDHRYYWNDVGPYYSVTTILDIIHKQALIPWAKRTVAEFAVETYLQGNLDSLIRTKGREAAAAYLASLPDYERNTAASLGTAVHRLADMAARGHQIDGEGFQISEQAQPYVDAFRSFLGRYSASNIVSSEKAVISFSEGYAGTYDFLLMLNGELWLVDVKTSKGLYPETGLQLAAYGNAEYIILPNDPRLYDMPHVDRYGVLHLRPDKYAQGWRFVEYQVTEHDYRAFLAARDLWAWRKEDRFRQTDQITVPVPA